jgi:hypothetical protein
MLFREVIAVYCQNHTKHKIHHVGKTLSSLTLKLVVHIVTTVTETVNRASDLCNSRTVHAKILKSFQPANVRSS